MTQCQKCALAPAVATILAPQNGDMRETHLCELCRGEWHRWCFLIYGKRYPDQLTGLRETR